MSTKFQISEFETVEEGGNEVQVDSDTEKQQQLGRQNQTDPDLHLQDTFQTNSGEAANPRSRLGSDPAQLELGTAEERRRPRGRSKSEPAIMWVATHYGRELRRMSDEFDMAFQGPPRPNSAGNTSGLKQAGGCISFVRGIFGRIRRKEDLAKPKKF